MSITPIVFPLLSARYGTAQETPAPVQQQHRSVAATPVPQPAQPALHKAAPAQASQLIQIQRLYLAGQSVAQIASEVGLTVSDINFDLGITPNSIDATPSASAAKAIAAYQAAPQAAGANQPAAATSGSQLSFAS